MKKLMIMGAGIYQVPLIKKAKELGIYTIVVSIPGPYPGFALADEVLYLDTRDRAAVLAAARERGISGICTTGTDVAVRTIGYVADALGLSGISAEAAEIVTDKRNMKAAFARGGVRTAAFREVCSLEEAKTAARGIGYPICLKAVDKSGSRGIRKVLSEEELPEAYDLCRSVTDRDYLLVEEYITADEIGVDGFVKNGKMVLCLPHNKFVYRAGKVCIPGGHQFPYRCSDDLRADIEKEIAAAIAACGMDNCAFNADVFVKDEKAWLIEIGGRCGATCIPEILSIYCGYDYYEKMILSAMGEEVDFSYSRTRPAMAKLLFSEREGKLLKIRQEVLDGLDEAGINWHLDYKAGDILPAVQNGTDRIGHLYMATDKEEEIDRGLALLKEALVY